MTDPVIPNVPSSLPPGQVPFFTAIKGALEYLLGHGRFKDSDRAVKLSELEGFLGRLDDTLDDVVLGGTGTTALGDVPDPPTNLVVAEGAFVHSLTWDNPSDTTVWFIEIWVAEDSEDRDNALLQGIYTVVGSSRGEQGSFQYSGFDITSDLTYWIRSVSYTGLYSPWHPTDVQGGYVVQGADTVQETIDELLSVLAGEITESELYAALNTRLDSIDTPTTGLLALVATLRTEIETSGSGLLDRVATIETNIDSIVQFDVDSTYAVDDVISYDDKIYICILAITTTPAPVPTNTTYWEKIGESSSLAGNIAANSVAINDVTTLAETNEGDISTNAGDITALETTVDNGTTGVIATATALGSLDTRVETNEGDITVNADDITVLDSYIKDPVTGVETVHADAIDALEATVNDGADGVTATAGKVLALETTVDDPATGVVAHNTAIDSLETTVNDVSDGVTATAGKVLALETTVNDGTTGLPATNALLITEQQTRATADEGLASDITTGVATAATDATTKADAAEDAANEYTEGWSDAGSDVTANSAAFLAEQTATADSFEAQATSIDTVETTVGSHTTAISTNLTSINGIQGKYSVKVNVNGYMSGFGLISTDNDGVPTSEFVILSDTFSIVTPGAEVGETPVVPFVVGEVDGVSTVGIDGNLVVDGTILAPAIQADAVKAEHLDTNELFIGLQAQSTDYIAGASGWKINNTVAEFNSIIMVIKSGSSGYSNLADKPSSLAGINSTEGTKLAGVADGADVTDYDDTQISNGSVINGANLYPNSGFRNTDGWPAGGGTLDTTYLTLGVDLRVDWQLLNGHTLYLEQVASQESGETLYQDYIGDYVPVEVGKTYCASVYTGAHRCRILMYVQWFTSAYVHVSNTSGGYNENDQEASGGPALSGYKRVYAIGVAPATAAVARIVLRKFDGENGSTSSFGFWSNLMFSEVNPGQTEPPAYQPYGTDDADIRHASDITTIDGGKIYTGSITATKIAANSITAAQIQAGAITANEILAGTITATEIAANAITAAKILAGTITATEIAANAITAAKIFAGTITADRIKANNITTIVGATGSGSASASISLTLAGDVVIIAHGMGNGVDGSNVTVKWDGVTYWISYTSNGQHATPVIFLNNQAAGAHTANISSCSSAAITVIATYR